VQTLPNALHILDWLDWDYLQKFKGQSAKKLDKMKYKIDFIFIK